jgi:Ca2+-binding RTX toxin-like protein
MLAGADNTRGDAEGDKLTNIENLIGSSNDDSLTGNAQNNLLHGRLGADTLDGGDGIDTASYAGSAAVTVSLVANTVNTGGEAAGDKLTNIENLIGSSNDDSLTGNSDVNRLEGGDGNDRLIGGGGIDTLVGGAGNDTYVISNTGVTIIDISGNDTVESSIDFTLQAGLDNLKLSGTATKGTGNESANIITGNGDNNELYGGAGNDTFVISSSGLSTGTFDGGTNIDTLKFTASSTATIDLTSIENTKFLSIEKVDLTDTTGTNVLKLNFNSVKNLVDITSGTPTLSVKLGTGDTIDFVADTGQQVFNNITAKTMTIFGGSSNALEQLAVINYA